MIDYRFIDFKSFYLILTGFFFNGFGKLILGIFSRDLYFLYFSGISTGFFGNFAMGILLYGEFRYGEFYYGDFTMVIFAVGTLI